MTHFVIAAAKQGQTAGIAIGGPQRGCTTRSQFVRGASAICQVF